MKFDDWFVVFCCAAVVVSGWIKGEYLVASLACFLISTRIRATEKTDAHS